MSFTFNDGKELAAAPRPLGLADFTFPDGATLHVSSLAVTFGGNSYEARVSEQQMDQLAALTQQGIDRVPSVTIPLADPTGSLFTTYERGRGFKGAKLFLRFALYDPVAGAFSTDNIVPFVGECDQPLSDDSYLNVKANSILNLSRFSLPMVPIQPRCQWVNPITVAQRAEAGAATSYKDSLFFLCGETRDVVTAPPCQYTPQTCTQPLRFGGSTWAPKQSDTGINYISGGKWSWVNADTTGKYKGYFPTWLGGAGWITAEVLQQWGDGNYTRGELAVGFGAVNVQRVIANGVELSRDGKDYFWEYTNNGARDGAVNLDAEPASAGPGNPYGNLTVIEYRAPKAVIPPESKAQVQVLGEKLLGGVPSMQSSISITSSAADQGPIVIQFGRVLGGSDPGDGSPITITGSTWSGRHGTTGIPVNGTFIMRLLELPYDHATLQGTWADGTGGSATLTYNKRNQSGGGPTPSVLAESLSWCGIGTGDLNAADFATADAICNATITYTDGAGNTLTQPRFSSAVVIAQRTGVADIVTGLKQSIGAYLTIDSGGLVSIRIEGPLGEQQPSLPDGSNDVSGVTSTLRTGSTVTGYRAYLFDESNYRGLRRLPQALAQMPNRVTFSFQDPAQGYAMSTFSIVEPDDVARVGYEIPGGLQVNPQGIASYNHANRCGKLGLAKILRGNPSVDTRGTDYWEWQTSFRAAKLRIGDIVGVTSSKYGLTAQSIRITQIRPDKDFGTMTLQGYAHDDQWYLDSHGNTPDPGYVAGINNGLGVTAAPTFGVEISAIDSSTIEVTGLAFSPVTNVSSMNSGTWSFYFTDYATPLATLAATVAAADATLTVTDASLIAHVVAGDYLLLVNELVLVNAAPTGAVVPITRVQLGSASDVSVASGASIWQVQVNAQNVSFPLDFINSAAADTWELDVSLPGMLLLSVGATVTNAYGHSPTTYVCFTSGTGHGLALSTTGSAPGGYRVVNVSNTDTTLTSATPGQIVSVVATTRDTTITLPLESGDVGNVVTIKRAAGSTHNVIVQEHAGDTIDGSSSVITLDGTTQVWTGIGI